MPARPLVVLRRLSQIAWTAFFVYVLWSTTYPLTGGVSPNVLFAGDPLIVGISSIAGRLVVDYWWIALVFLVLTALLGRFFCGWVCPLGFCSDAAARLRPSRRRVFPPAAEWRPVKYAILALLVLAAVFGLQLAWVLDPIVIAARFVSLNLIPAIVTSTDRAFAWAIPRFGWYGAPLDFYRWLKGGLLGVNAHLFGHSIVIFAVFALIVLAAAIARRFWCRVLCPLGALYALAARRPFLRRVVRGCSECGTCHDVCRMAAIAEGERYDPAECILCLDCVYDCPVSGTAFSFTRPVPATAGAVVAVSADAETAPSHSGTVTRGQFLELVAGAAAALGPGRSLASVLAPGTPTAPEPAEPIRPPGALPEARFVDRCIRCGNCMKVCVTNVLQPCVTEGGWEGVWTPRLVPEAGYCEYHCTLCGQVCPVRAIEPLAEERKQKVRIGLAWFDHALCIPWAGDRECIVCQEHCPVPEKAIKLETVVVRGKRIKRPRVDAKLCIGCGICTFKCPVRPRRAVTVYTEAQWHRVDAAESL